MSDTRLTRTMYAVIQTTLTGTPYADGRRVGEHETHAAAQSHVARLASTRDDAYSVAEVRESSSGRPVLYHTLKRR